MPSAVENLWHDAAGVQRFVELIQQFCSEQRSLQTYAGPTTEFFDYVEGLACGTTRYIRRLANTSQQDPQRVRFAREDLQNIKEYWRLLHAFIKPAADAHILQLPAPLIDLATSQLSKIHGMDKSNVVVLSTPELMYFQTRHTGLRRTASELAKIIPEAELGRGLGFVELPYSQGLSLFTNLVIYHELGHFAFEELWHSEELEHPFATLEAAIIDSLKTHLGALYQGLPLEEKLFLVGVLWNWSEELFADLIALRMVGPAFTFALIEVSNLLGFMGDSREITFNNSHPSYALRLKQQLELLEESSWWDIIKDLDAGHRQLLEEVAAKSTSTSPTLNVVGPPVASDPKCVDAFKSVLHEIRTLAIEMTVKTAAAPADFKEFRATIESALMTGVVPSSFWSDEKIGFVTPPPVAILNAAFCFYLTLLPTLMGSLRDQKPWDVGRRSFWTQRLEAWTLKAIEDCQIIQDYQGAKHERAIRGED